MTPRPYSNEIELRRFEAYFAEAIDLELGTTTPSQLDLAIRHAVFNGAGRLRPALGLALAHAMGVGKDQSALALCTAVELVHSASLVHDDLPCFDDAAIRRGQPSVHAKFGQAIAVLTGDALIAMAFSVLARKAPHSLAMVGPLAQSIGAARGIIGGQALECEPAPVNCDRYHDAKTGALFAVLTQGIATIAKSTETSWTQWGLQIGRIYQRCDDLADLAPAARTGKPQGQDKKHARPTWASAQSGFESLQEDLEQWLASTPACSTRVPLIAWAAAFELRLRHRLGI